MESALKFDETNPTHWALLLLQVLGLGATRGQALLQSFGNAQAIFAASRQALQNLNLKFSEKTYEWLQNPDFQSINKSLAWLAENPENHHFIAYDSPHYPENLREIKGAPLGLFVAGAVNILSEPQLAIVGARQPTPLGLQTAYDFAEKFGQVGMIVTSGLAFGIDAAAHQGALAARAPTIAVFGTSLDQIYPSQHQNLARNILESGGAWVSEYPPGTPPLKAHFPMRNRIISGLSQGVIVVEAALGSGSLITARNARDDNREVFAVPGPVNSPLSSGCHALIRDGARLVTVPEEVLFDLSPTLYANLAPDTSHKKRQVSQKPEKTPKILPAKLAAITDPRTNDLLTYLHQTPQTIDQIAQKSGWEIAALSSELLILELNGDIQKYPDGRYGRV